MLHSIVSAESNISMFDINANILINPCNCIGVMGGGLALEFKNRYPDMFKDYVEYCSIGFQPGMVHTWPVAKNKFVFNVPTKSDLSDSTEKLLKTSLTGLLVSLVALRPFLANSVIAMPALGCGLGNMSWDTQVKDMLIQFANDPRLDDYQFVLFEPKKS